MNTEEEMSIQSWLKPVKIYIEYTIVSSFIATPVNTLKWQDREIRAFSVLKI